MQQLQRHYLDMDYIASRHLAALHVLMVHQRLRSTNVQKLCIPEDKAAFAQKAVEQATAKQVEGPSYRLLGASWQHQLAAHKADAQNACLCQKSTDFELP